VSVVELFAGAGGSALGLEAAGFEHLACIENNPDACKTLRDAGFPCIEADVRDPEIYESRWVGETLLWSSFPCKPWSTSGARYSSRLRRTGRLTGNQYRKA
jgi:DNA (cytosine-5)-methyltransferase 1